MVSFESICIRFNFILQVRKQYCDEVEVLWFSETSELLINNVTYHSVRNKKIQRRLKNLTRVFSFCKKIPLHTNRMLCKHFVIKGLNYPNTSLIRQIGLFDYHVFSQLEESLNDRRFYFNEEVIEAVDVWFVEQDIFLGLHTLQVRYNKCI